VALVIAAIGCSDDKKSGGNDAGATGGSGGSTAGTGGNGGSGGSGGTLTVAECKTMSVANMAPEACAACVCEMATEAASACAKNADCWPLLNCIGMNCPTAPTCALSKCGTWAATGAADAQGLSATLQGACKTACLGGGTKDAGGGDDGGTDAGN
jgi:hypothetical protein